MIKIKSLQTTRQAGHNATIYPLINELDLAVAARCQVPLHRILDLVP
ncbi:MAG: hypothetical protein ACTSWN_05260 [Promethearchaeota archaeon]